MSVGLSSVPTMNELDDAAWRWLWGKSKAGDSPNLLIQHLLDAAAVMELIWDHYLAPSVRAQIDACCGGQGKALCALIAGLHDVGKATPSFQAKSDSLAAPVRACGLSWGRLGSADHRWFHTLAGAAIVGRVLKGRGWSRKNVAWVTPLISGHHGRIPDVDEYLRVPREGHGRALVWSTAHEQLVDAVAQALGISIDAFDPVSAPTRAVQLVMSGAVIMADWIASGVHFPGIYDVERTGMAVARGRASGAWGALRISGGWRDLSLSRSEDLLRSRFGRSARPVQALAIESAWTMPGPGLLLVEAAMGEGKTELALAAAEVLAFRFGADGVFVGMPTQATSDALYNRSVSWADRIDVTRPMGLLHGKRRFNTRWWELEQLARTADIHDEDEYGCTDDYGHDLDDRAAARAAPSAWFLGPKLGLLMRSSVGTIDQLLYAATRTRHVMLRHLGLAGRVVILDEVHAYDVYMMQFLCEALRWLADAQVPVIMLSATLPPPVRSMLASAYLQGTLQRRRVTIPAEWNRDAGYPVVRTLTTAAEGPAARSQGAAGWRASSAVEVEILDEDDSSLDRLSALLEGRLAEGGCVLIIRNTVARAQATFTHLNRDFHARMPVVLLHSRIVMGERANRTEQVLQHLGPPPENDPGGPRPPLIVVATQLAEQSFDVDADLLISDLAPIDLLLQRAGRLHRHTRAHRPARLMRPTMVVTGMARSPGKAPHLPRGSEYVYGRYMLLRAAALVCEAADGTGWSLPQQVPELVGCGYGEEHLGPVDWQQQILEAHEEFTDVQQRRAEKAAPYLLSGEAHLNRRDLAGLHVMPARDPEDDEDAVNALVRDGEDSVEVILIRSRGEGRYTLHGEWLGSADTRVSDPEITQALLRSSLRLPARLTHSAIKELQPLIENGGDPWLCRTRVLELDSESRVVLGTERLRYDDDLGLVSEGTT